MELSFVPVLGEPFDTALQDATRFLDGLPEQIIGLWLAGSVSRGKVTPTAIWTCTCWWMRLTGGDCSADSTACRRRCSSVHPSGRAATSTRIAPWAAVGAGHDGDGRHHLRSVRGVCRDRLELLTGERTFHEWDTPPEPI